MLSIIGKSMEIFLKIYEQVFKKFNLWILLHNKLF